MERRVFVQASPRVVWATLHDPVATGALFPELRLGPAVPSWPAAATTRTARARVGLLRESAQVESLEARPESVFRMRVSATGFDSEWSWRLEPVAGGTRVIHAATFEPIDRWAGPPRPSGPTLARGARRGPPAGAQGASRALAVRLRLRAPRGAAALQARDGAGNVRGWTPSSSRSSPSARCCTSPGTSGSRRPGTRCGRPRSGCWRRHSGSCRRGSSCGGRAAADPSRRTAWSSGSCPGSWRRATSSCCPLPTVVATSRSSTRSRAGRRRSSRSIIGVGILGERLGVAGSIGVLLLLLGFLLLQQPWQVLRGHRGIDPSIAFAHRDRGRDRHLHARSTGSGRASSPRSRTRRSCGSRPSSSCSSGCGSSPGATSSPVDGSRSAARPSVAG